jgi:ATP-dependent RNA helicase DDX27
VVKAAVKAGRAQGAKIVSRVVDAAEADAWAAQVEGLADEIDAILAEEKEDKQLAQAEVQVRRGENLMMHEDEIKGRPRRTWFESEADKRAAKKMGRAELNGDVAEALKKKKEGKLSNKDKKRLDDSAARKDGKVWKKGRKEREGKGALASPGKVKGKGKGIVKGKNKKKIKGGKPARR